MPKPTGKPETRAERENRQGREIEESQQQLRDSIARTQELLSKSDEMLKRHRTERDDSDS